MTDLVLLICFVMFATMGFLAPFVFMLGYVWVDTFLPQYLSYGLLSTIPMSLILAVCAFGFYMAADRRDPPRFTGLQVLIVLLAIWITLTTTWAIVPAMAWQKWDPSFKMLLSVIFMPFVFRSRVQIEAFVLVWLLAAAPHLLPWGIKTGLTGGGYGMSLGLLPPNAAWIAESSAIAAMATMFVPLLSWVRTHTLLLPWKKPVALGTIGLSVVFLVATIGTFARTGIIAMGLLGIGMFLRSKHKFVFILAAVLMVGVLGSVASDKWTERISTIKQGSAESSSGTRVLVWQWTWEFAKSHPLGGGFNAFLTNRISSRDADGTETVQFGRAFHNFYFSSLGEHGYPGLILVLTILCTALLTLQRTIRQCKNRPALAWAGDLARAVQLGLAIAMLSGMFIDVSYNYMVWYPISLAMCLSAHVKRAIQVSAEVPAALAFPRPGPLPVFRPSIGMR